MVINKSRLSLNVKEQNDDFLYGRMMIICMEIREPNSFTFSSNRFLLFLFMIFNLCY